MQGQKQYQEKLFVNFQLSERVPQDNFYRRLKKELDLSFLRKLTVNYYGKEGQPYCILQIDANRLLGKYLF